MGATRRYILEYDTSPQCLGGAESELGPAGRGCPPPVATARRAKAPQMRYVREGDVAPRRTPVRQKAPPPEAPQRIQRGGVGIGIAMAPPIGFIQMKYPFLPNPKNRNAVRLFTALVLGGMYPISIFITPF